MSDPLFRRYIQHMVYEALTQENVRLHKLVEDYVVDMLTDFILIDPLNLGEGLPVLTWMYADATSLVGPRRIAALKRLGDVALFLSGIFADYVRMTVNGLGYYIDMGRAAYDLAARSAVALNPIFDELSKKFIPLVTALNAVSIQSSLSRGFDSDSLLELYVRDSSNLALRDRMMERLSIPIISTVGLG